MRLGSSLVGAIVGAAIGVGAQLGLERGMGIEAPWFAIVIGLVTGLGARALAGEYIKNTSYVRGALAALIALAAIVGGSFGASAMIKAQSLKEFEAQPAPKFTEPEAPDETAEGEAGEEEAEPAGEEVVEEEAVAEEETPDGEEEVIEEEAIEQPAPRPSLSRLEVPPMDEKAELETSLWDAAFFALGTFLAYEFARGGGGKQTPPPVEET